MECVFIHSLINSHSFLTKWITGDVFYLFHELVADDEFEMEIRTDNL